MADLNELNDEDRAELERQVRAQIEDELRHENEIRLEALEKDLRTEIGPRIRQEIENAYRLSQAARSSSKHLLRRPRSNHPP